MTPKDITKGAALTGLSRKERLALGVAGIGISGVLAGEALLPPAEVLTKKLTQDQWENSTPFDAFQEMEIEEKLGTGEIWDPPGTEFDDIYAENKRELAHAIDIWRGDALGRLYGSRVSTWNVFHCLITMIYGDITQFTPLYAVCACIRLRRISHLRRGTPQAYIISGMKTVRGTNSNYRLP